MLYQRDASFIARLDNPPNASMYDDDALYGGNGGESSSSESLDNQLSNDIEVDDDDNDGDELVDDDNDVGGGDDDDTGVRMTNAQARAATKARTTTTTTTSTTAPYVPAASNYFAISMEDMSVYDDVNNNRLNLPSPPQQVYFKPADDAGRSLAMSSKATAAALSAASTTTVTMVPADLETSSVTSFGADLTSHSYIRIDVYDNKAADEQDSSVGDKMTGTTTKTTTASRAAETITEVVVGKGTASDHLPSTIATTEK